MDLPWRSLRPHIVTLNDETGLVEYHSTFEELKVTNRWHDSDETSNINEALYRHKDNLETIFRAIDKDNSGSISYRLFFIILVRNFITTPWKRIYEMSSNTFINIVKHFHFQV